MKSLGAALAAFAASACLESASAQRTSELPPDQVEAARERAMKGEAFFILLKDPSRCGTPSPRGYACALVLYRDISAEKDSDRIPEALTARVTGMSGADGPPHDAKVRVLSPFDASPRTVSPVDMTRLRMSMVGDRSGAEIATLEMQGVLGYAENEALPAGDARKIDRKRFRLPR